MSFFSHKPSCFPISLQTIFSVLHPTQSVLALTCLFFVKQKKCLSKTQNMAFTIPKIYWEKEYVNISFVMKNSFSFQNAISSHKLKISYVDAYIFVHTFSVCSPSRCMMWILAKENRSRTQIICLVFNVNIIASFCLQLMPQGLDISAKLLFLTSLVTEIKTHVNL